MLSRALDSPDIVARKLCLHEFCDHPAAPLLLTPVLCRLLGLSGSFLRAVFHGILVWMTKASSSTEQTWGSVSMCFLGPVRGNVYKACVLQKFGRQAVAAWLLRVFIPSASDSSSAGAAEPRGDGPMAAATQGLAAAFVSSHGVG